jgi:hypothetical protein
VAYTAAVVMRRSLVMASAYLHSEVLRSRVLRLYREARELNRVRLRGAVVYVDPSADGSCACQASLVNMNDEAFLMHCRQPLPDGVQRSFKLRIQSRRRRRRSRIKTAVCKGSIEQTRSVGDTYAYVVRYKAATTSSQYVIEQHFLRKSLAHP